MTHTLSKFYEAIANTTNSILDSGPIALAKLIEKQHNVSFKQADYIMRKKTAQIADALPKELLQKSKTHEQRYQLYIKLFTILFRDLNLTHHNAQQIIEDCALSARTLEYNTRERK